MNCPNCGNPIIGSSPQCAGCKANLFQWLPRSELIRLGIPLSSHAARQSRAAFASQRKFWACFTALIMVCLISCWLTYQNWANRLTAEEVRVGTITIYGHPEEVAAALQLRKMQYKIVPVSGLEDMEQTGLFNRAEEAGLTFFGMISLPIVEVSGKLVESDQFFEVLKEIPLSKSVRPYIHVYGPANCPKTTRKIAELAQRGLPYEFRDVNSAQYGTTFRAILLSVKVSGRDWPLIDVNQHYLSRPQVSEVEKWYRSPSLPPHANSRP